MSLITKPEDLKKKEIFKGLIYGSPGIGKSTIALSSPNPLCIDLDRGMNRVEKRFQSPSLQVENYQQILDLINSDKINDYKTIVIDTLGKLVDRIGDWLAIKNPKVRNGNGQLSIRGWGELKYQFITFFKLLESKNKSLIFVAHEREERHGEDTKVRLDVSGSSGKEIVKELDFMGYMEMRGNKRVITFTPTEKFYAKNSLGLNDAIEVPDTIYGNNFITEKIINLTQEKLEKDAKTIVDYNNLKAEIKKDIEKLKTVEEVNSYYNELLQYREIWDSLFIGKRLLRDKTKELGIEFDKEKKEFVKIKTKKEEVA